MKIHSIGVYRIVSPNNSCYIGMTAKSFEERWNAHRANFRKGQMTCIGLQRAFEKHGIDHMRFEVLEDMPSYGDSEILHRERIWWLRHKAWDVNLYNGEPTGRGAVRHTEETRQKIRLGRETYLESQGSLQRIKPCLNCGEPLTVEGSRIHCPSCKTKRTDDGWIFPTRRSTLRSNHDEAKRLYLVEKLSTREIGEIYGITQQSAHRILQEMGIIKPKKR